MPKLPTKTSRYLFQSENKKHVGNIRLIYRATGLFADSKIKNTDGIFVANLPTDIQNPSVIISDENFADGFVSIGNHHYR